MEDITYLGDQLNDSKRKIPFVELLRYSFSWFGINAIFARPALVSLIGVPPDRSEFAYFLVLFNSTPLPNAPAQLADLHRLLGSQVSSRLPGIPSVTPVTTLNAIQTKYLSHHKSKHKTANAIARAAISGNLGSLDLPTLLYAFRNWSVHGNALDGCFGSRPGFLQYIGILQQVLADVHSATAARLFAKI